VEFSDFRVTAPVVPEEHVAAIPPSIEEVNRIPFEIAVVADKFAEAVTSPDAVSVVVDTPPDAVKRFVTARIDAVIVFFLISILCPLSIEITKLFVAAFADW
jgi:hypothetical protein